MKLNTKILFYTVMIAGLFWSVGQLKSLDPPPAPTVSFPYNTLVEVYTGAWCHYCPWGSLMLDSLERTFPDKVIGVKVHYNDAMQIPDYDALIAPFYTMDMGYPSMMFNRTRMANEVIIKNFDQWYATALFFSHAIGFAQVDCKWGYNPNTREIVARVIGRVASSYVPPEYRLSALVVEDSVHGSGKGYDQENIFSKESGGTDTTNPYYYLPKLIKDYRHMNVARKYLGGAYGAEGLINHISQGIDSGATVFNYFVPDNFNIDNIKLVGIVNQWNESRKEVINSSKAQKIDLPFLVYSDGNDAIVQPNNVAHEKIVTIANKTNQEMTFYYSLALSSRTPANWAITALPEGEASEPPYRTITVAANATKNLIVKTVQGDKGASDIAIKFIDVKDSLNFPLRYAYSLYSAELETIELINDKVNMASACIPILPNQNGTTYGDLTDILPHLNKFTQLKNVIWSFGDDNAPTKDQIALISTLADNGVNQVLFGTMLIAKINGLGPALLAKLGISYLGACYQIDNNPVKAFYLEGFANDTITKGMSFGGGAISNYTQAIGITNTATTFPVLKHTGTDTVIAVRCQLPNSKFVFSGFYTLMASDTSVKMQYIMNILRWFGSEVNAVENGSILNDEIFKLEALPNPVSDRSTIKCTYKGNSAAKIQLYIVDLNGRVVSESISNEIMPGEHLINLPITNLSSGSYFVTVTVGTTRKNIPIEIIK